MITDESHTEEWTKIMTLRAQIAAVLDQSGVGPGGQAIAALMIAARCVERAQIPPDVTCAMLAGYVIRGEAV